MKKQRYAQGFSAVELLVTLFVAAAFLVAGYQLYNVIVKDGGLARAQTRAANVAYDYLQRYSLMATNPCTAATPLTNSPVPVNGLTNAQVTVTVTCPYSSSSGSNKATNISRVQVSMTYNNPQQTVQYVTFTTDSPTGTTSQTSLASPTNVTATATSTSQINLSWSPPTDYTPASYQIDYSKTSDFSSTTTISNISTTSTSVTGLSPSTQYYFRVEALNLQGTVSSPSGTAPAATYTNWMVYSQIAGVGDWNGDGKNDIVGYKPDGTIELHLGNGSAGFGPAYSLGNIGTVKSIVGPGKLPGGSAPILWWYNSAGSTFFTTSDGGTSTTGSPIATGGGYAACDSVFAAPKLISGQTNIVCKEDALYIETLSSTGTTSINNSFGSGWASAYPGNTAFGAGDFIGNDGKGDIIGITTGFACNTYQGLGNGTTNGASGTCGGGWTNNFVTGGWDYNGDGKPDILRLATAYSALCFYPGDGNGATSAGGSCTLPIN